VSGKILPITVTYRLGILVYHESTGGELISQIAIN